MESEQQPLRIGFLINDLETRPGSQSGCVPACQTILLDPIPVQQHKRVFELLPASMTFEAAAGVFDDRVGIAAGARPDVEVHAESGFVAAPLEKSGEGSVTIAFDTDIDRASPLDPM